MPLCVSKIMYVHTSCFILVWFMVFNATFNNISVISWRSVLLVEGTGVHEEHHTPVTSQWQTLMLYTSTWTGLNTHRLVVKIQLLYHNNQPHQDSPSLFCLLLNSLSSFEIYSQGQELYKTGQINVRTFFLFWNEDFWFIEKILNLWFSGSDFSLPFAKCFEIYTQYFRNKLNFSYNPFYYVPGF